MINFSFLRGGVWPPLFIAAIVFAMTALGPAAMAMAADTKGLDQRSDYRFGVGDLIRIQVHGEPDLKLETRLSEKGGVSYPFLGDIRVVGLTVAQLEERISNGLRGDYLVDPEVQVIVVEYRPFYVNGQVKRPGGYPYVPGLTVRKAAALAGGFTERASTSKLYLIRENDIDNNRTRVGLDVPLLPGDTLIVEEGLF